MIAKVEVERFNLISSRPFDKILAAIKAAIGHPDIVAFAKRAAAARTFRVRKHSSRRLGEDGSDALHGT